MSDLVLDASLPLQWFLEDEAGRQYGLSVPRKRFQQTRGGSDPVVLSSGEHLLIAYRRKRITFDQIDGFLTRLKALAIDAAQHVPTEGFRIASDRRKAQDVKRY